MFNVGGGEVLVILLIALIVLGPQRLPDAARQVGKVMSEVRRVSSGFQQEMKDAFEDVDGGRRTRRTETTPLAATVADVEGRRPADAGAPASDAHDAGTDGADVDGADVDDTATAAASVRDPASSDDATVAPAVAAALDDVVSPLDPPVGEAEASDTSPRPDGDALGGKRAAS